MAMQPDELSKALYRRSFRQGGMVPTPALTPGIAPTFAPGRQSVAAADVTANPSVNLSDVLSQFKEPEDIDQKHPVKAAIARALIGFGRGAKATPAGAYADRGLGGVIGGLDATGQAIQEAQASRATANEPRKKIIQSILEAQAKSAVEDPYKQTQLAREQAGRIDLENLRATNQKDLFKTRAKEGAKDSGVSEETFTHAQKEAARELRKQGVDPYSDEFQTLVDDGARARLKVREGVGVKGTKGVPAPKATEPKPAGKRSLSDIFK